MKPPQLILCGLFCILTLVDARIGSSQVAQEIHYELRKHQPMDMRRLGKGSSKSSSKQSGRSKSGSSKSGSKSGSSNSGRTGGSKSRHSYKEPSNEGIADFVGSETTFGASAVDKDNVVVTVSDPVVLPEAAVTPLNEDAQNDFITCIAVVEETSPFVADNDELWEEFRNKYPDRPFCLLQPYLPGQAPNTNQLYRPPAFQADENVIFQNVTADNGDIGLASDWYTLCKIDEAKRRGINKVSLYIDTSSGAAVSETIEYSYLLFQSTLVTNGFDLLFGESDAEEDWITPCMSTSTLARFGAETQPESPLPTAAPTTSRETIAMSASVVTSPPLPTSKPTNSPTKVPTELPTKVPTPFWFPTKIPEIATKSTTSPPIMVTPTKLPFPYPSAAPSESTVFSVTTVPTKPVALVAEDTSTQELDLISQNELLTCIAITDGTDPIFIDNDALWEEFRNKYPERPFCLLRATQLSGESDIAKVYRPDDFKLDESAIFRNVTRDNGDPTLASDWYSLCDLDESKKQGLTRVGLFVDTSGSASLLNVIASLDLFQQRTLENGFKILSGQQNNEEDWITPCLTTITHPDLQIPPSPSPTAMKASDEVQPMILGRAVGDKFGHSVSYSSGGNFMAVGSPGSNSNTGAVSVYELVDGAWVRKGQELRGVQIGDEFGTSVDLSLDGQFLVVGAPFHDTFGISSGQAMTFQYYNEKWEPVSVLNGHSAEDNCGYSVSSSDDGLTVVVACPNIDESRSGEVRVYVDKGGNNGWYQMGQTLTGQSAGELFGFSVELSGDGGTLVVGLPGRSRNGVNSGGVNVYRLVKDWWVLDEEFDGDNIGSLAGQDVALSQDGKVVAFGMPGYSTSFAENSNGAIRVYMYIESNQKWIQQGFDIIGAGTEYSIGQNIALSGDGSYMAYYAGPVNDVPRSPSGGLIVVSYFDMVLWNWKDSSPTIVTNAPGARYAVDISDDGTRIVVGYYSEKSPGAVMTSELALFVNEAPTPMPALKAPTASPAQLLDLPLHPSTAPTHVHTLSLEPSPAPTRTLGLPLNPSPSTPALLLEDQNEILTCISIIDENKPTTVSEVDAQWEELREKYPSRPFCLLQPNLPGRAPSNAQLIRPTKFRSDSMAIFKNVNRDNSDSQLVSDWYDICNLAEAREKGVTHIVLFVDNSGTMTTDTVSASYTLFLEKLYANGFEVIAGSQTHREDYISPCITATAS